MVAETLEGQGGARLCVAGSHGFPAGCSGQGWRRRSGPAGDQGPGEERPGGKGWHSGRASTPAARVAGAAWSPSRLRELTVAGNCMSPEAVAKSKGGNDRWKVNSPLTNQGRF